LQLVKVLAMMVTAVRVIWRVLHLIKLHVGAGHCFINKGMENLFFPTVASCTIALQGTSVLIFGNEISCLPLGAELERVIIKKVWFASEVLPIVRIDALSLIMLMCEGTPLGFESEHVEFSRCHYSLFLLVLTAIICSFLVVDKLMDQRRFDVLLVVCERAVIPILAFGEGKRTKLKFVSIWMI